MIESAALELNARLAGRTTGSNSESMYSQCPNLRGSSLRRKGAYCVESLSNYNNYENIIIILEYKPYDDGVVLVHAVKTRSISPE